MNGGDEKRGRLIVISGASGTGKSTVISELLNTMPELAYSISATTRSPRGNEKNGVDYFFIPKAEFQRMIDEDEMLEYVDYNQNMYGTPLGPVNRMRDEGRDVILEIEVFGAANVKRACPEAILIFLIPPSFRELEKRLRGRMTDSDREIAGRLRISGRELEAAISYDYIVINANVAGAVDDIAGILEGGPECEKLRVEKMKSLVEEVRKDALSFDIKVDR